MEYQLRNKTFISSMAGMAAVVAVAGSANAAVTAFSPINGMIESGGIANGNALMVFTVGESDITVSALGSFNGYDGTRAVGIFAWDGSAGSREALVSGNVTTTDNTQGGTTQGGFSYAACFMTLTARLQYVLVGQTVVGSYEYGTSFTNAGVGSGISFDSYWYNFAAPLNATPSNTSADPFPYFGPNFQFSVVPAPGALALLGVAGLIGARRRRA
jgi:MYXO-CTERM domain-containing protein